MAFSVRDESRIVANADSLDVRLRRRAAIESLNEERLEVSARLDRWCDVVAQGEEKLFAERLALDGLDLEAARRVLSARSGADVVAPAPWLGTLKEALSGVDASIPTDAGPAQADAPLPFEDAYAPFLAFARRRLREQVASAQALVSARAHAQLERILLRRLSFLCGRSLQVQFSVYRARRRSSLGRLLSSGETTTDDRLYLAFIDMLVAGGLKSFLGEYPVIARLIVAVCEHWVSFIAEFVRRLHEDLGEIQEYFGSERPLGALDHIKPAFSDPHNHGRTVIAFAFESGTALIYKPKPAGLEAGWADFVSWLNAHDVPLGLKAARVLDRQDYGWAEFVQQRPCTSTAAAKRYYQRSGMLVCLVYALQGTDFHQENLIACGEHPVLIDLETLLHPRVRDADAQRMGEAHLRAQRHLEHSVLRTGLLPAWDIAPGGAAYDVSGLGGIQEWSFRRLAWKHVNTDAMTLAHESAISEPEPNAPVLEGDPLSPGDFVDDIVHGFRTMYGWLCEHRDVVLAASGPLAGIRHRHVRFVFRPTKVYAALLDKLSHPRYFRCGLDRSIELDVLTQGVVELGRDAPWWPVLKAEQAALERLDVPLFMAPVDSEDLPLPSAGTVEGFFEKSPWEQLCSSVQSLNEDDMNEQVALIRAAFDLGDGAVSEHVTVVEELRAIAGAGSTCTPEELTQHALEIAADLQARAIRAPDGSVDWICPTFVTRAKRFQLQPIGFNLYDGACGLALFFGALERLTPTGEFGDFAIRTLRPVRESLKRTGSRRSLTALLGIGGTSGLGSIVYGLATASALVADRSLLADAEAAASLITPEVVREASVLDVTDGVAGAALGLLALHRITGERQILDVAVECGDRLVAARIDSPSGHTTWKTLEGALLTGFSHGAAGIAYALLRLYDATGREEFLKAAEEGVEYERSQFSVEEGNWADLRRTPGDAGTELRFMTSWCHGAPGIGLARLGALDVLDTTEINRDVAVALATTLNYGARGADHLCCGNLGRLDLAIEASQRLGRPDLLHEARRQATEVVARAAREGSYLLNVKPLPGMYMPGLFNGLAGIGYGLLRLASPDSLPSVLLWE